MLLRSFVELLRHIDDTYVAVSGGACNEVDNDFDYFAVILTVIKDNKTGRSFGSFNISSRCFDKEFH